MSRDVDCKWLKTWYEKHDEGQGEAMSECTNPNNLGSDCCAMCGLYEPAEEEFRGHPDE